MEIFRRLHLSIVIKLAIEQIGLLMDAKSHSAIQFLAVYLSHIHQTLKIACYVVSMIVQDRKLSICIKKALTQTGAIVQVSSLLTHCFTAGGW